MGSTGDQHVQKRMRKMVSTTNSQLTVKQRLRYFFADTWWRIAWFVGGVAWCAGVNTIVIANSGDLTWWGPLSVLPLLAFAVDTLRRDSELRKARRH